MILLDGSGNQAAGRLPMVYWMALLEGWGLLLMDGWGV